MKIKTTVAQEREIDVVIPFFRKDQTFFSGGKIFAVLDEKTVVNIYDVDDRTAVSIDSPKRYEKDIADAYENMAEISEREFFEAYAKAIDRLSLTPQLIVKQDAKANDIPDHLFSGIPELDKEIEDEISRGNSL